MSKSWHHLNQPHKVYNLDIFFVRSITLSAFCRDKTLPLSISSWAYNCRISGKCTFTANLHETEFVICKLCACFLYRGNLITNENCIYAELDINHLQVSRKDAPFLPLFFSRYYFHIDHGVVSWDFQMKPHRWVIWYNLEKSTVCSNYA